MRTRIGSRGGGRSPLLAWAVAAGAAMAAGAAVGPGGVEWNFTPFPESIEAVPPLPPPAVFPVQLVLDDDGAEGDFGLLSGQGARQFLWFNRFTPAGGFSLEEIWVLYPSDPNVTVGAAVQLAVYTDADGNPANGAVLETSFAATVQAADGNTFSIYPVVPPVLIPSGGDVLIGVVPRFIVSGVTPPTQPAALDTTASQQRSWLGIWSGDPPDPPVLSPPPDQFIGLVDGFQPGNWMIRGFGSQPPALGIPTLSGRGLAVLIGFLALAGAVLAHRRWVR